MDLFLMMDPFAMMDQVAMTDQVAKTNSSAMGSMNVTTMDPATVKLALEWRLEDIEDILSELDDEVSEAGRTWRGLFYLYRIPNQLLVLERQVLVVKILKVDVFVVKIQEESTIIACSSHSYARRRE
jgi:hypothetical protein